ncbi:ABC transporter permease [Halomicrococcus gelatinilyticus]|uniref:ABC transporter permease n=1 Tax=Halomicrococcus gelatinilyticus TaxID=1702103 RepID=UPI002E11ACAE
MSDGLRAKATAGLQRLVDASTLERLGLSVAALFAALLVGAGLLLASGYNPIVVYYWLFYGAIGSSFNVALTLQQMTLLLLTGLAVAVSFRAGLFNIGTQGQLVLGALATALTVLAVAPVVPGGLVGTLVLVPLGLLAGAVVGGAYGAIPGALKAYADANEVITTIMLNFIASGVAFYLVNNYFRVSSTVATENVPGNAKLQPVVFHPSSSFSILVFIGALALVAGIYHLFRNTAFGYELRTSGLQPAAASYAGVDAERMTVASMTLSGAVGGLAGAIFVLMVEGRYIAPPSLGFDGITVSILAGNNPLGVVPAALLFGVLKSGGLTVGFQTDVPPELIGVLRGLIILFVAMPEFFRMLGGHVGVGNRDAVATDGGQPGETDADEGGDDDA